MRVNEDEFTLRIDEYTFNFKRRKEVSSVWTAADHEWRKREASITVIKCNAMHFLHLTECNNIVIEFSFSKG